MLVTVLALSLLAGEQTVDQIVARAARTFGRQPRWLRPLARRYLTAFAGRTRPRRRDVIQFLLRDRSAARFSRLPVANWLPAPQRMQPVEAASHWDLPVLETIGDLAAWLECEPGELDWFADLKGLLSRRGASPRLRHYHYRVLQKRSGGQRLIEAPKPRLKEIQRRILTSILDKVPAHPAVHGFVRGRSIQTFAAPHVGQPVVLRMDLQDFFPSFPGARVQTVFRTFGYPESVADLLGGICTNATPRDVWPHREPFDRPHLPQGAPTSPALANICTYRADCRLAGLARSDGVAYTRYADDLAFSGDADFDRFSIHAAAILNEEGLNVNHRKTRVMHQGVRQHLAGLVTNDKLNVIRADYDCLKAILTNCIRTGPANQNREAHPDFHTHLQGRGGLRRDDQPRQRDPSPPALQSNRLVTAIELRHAQRHSHPCSRHRRGCPKSQCRYSVSEVHSE
jgi:retron-type reverse transcriptase